MCMENMKPEYCMVTSCGHLFRKSCIETCVAAHGQCPTCRGALQTTNLQAAVDILSSVQGTSSGRISRFGSKLQAVCEQLESIWAIEPEGKIIIFVQFDVILRKTEAALKDLRFPCLTLQGSIFDRRKTIRQFQAAGADHRVLLISLEKSPSGMNLVCCHHLILVHPMYADSQTAALHYERQAIGRCRRRGQTNKVHVYRFFTRETIEDKLTKDHHAELCDQAQAGSSGDRSSTSSAIMPT